MTLRLSRLREQMAERELRALLIMQPQNRRYLSGFSGSTGWLLITPEKALLLTDSRYWEQVGREVPHFELVKLDNQKANPFVTTLVECLERCGVSGAIGFEADSVTVAQFEQLQEALPHLQWTGAGEALDELRLIKDPAEVELMRRAARIADEALAALEPRLRPGTTEREIAAALQYEMKLRGAEKESFDAIVASGPNGALPHAKPTDRAFCEGDLVTIDFGATYQGYNSDMTRTVAIGQVNGKLADIYRLVRRAQQTALEALRPGLTCKQADAIARDMIEAAGYGELFGHSLGHGVGLAVHENPRVGRNSDTVLRRGMVVTVEPGVYVPELGGVRIEDMAFITDDGYDVLTTAPKLDL
jgi:Xaa-Pro aminopeptidase